jgi:hypothetical protein
MRPAKTAGTSTFDKTPDGIYNWNINTDWICFNGNLLE